MRFATIAVFASAIVLGFGALALVWLLARPLAILVLAFTIAQALSAIVDRLSRHASRAVGVALVYLVLLGGLAALGWWLLPIVLAEARALVERAPELAARALQSASNWTGLSAAQLEQSVLSAIGRARSTLLQIPVLTLSALFEALVIIFLSMYLLLAGPQLQGFVLSLVPRRRRSRTRRLMSRVGHAMGGYIRGAAIDGAVMATLTWAALSIIGLSYAPVFAVLALLGEFVPYVGPIVAALPAIIVAVLDSPTQALIVAATYVGLQQVDSHLIVPNIMRTQTRIHPALVIFAIASGFAVGGVLGAIVAIPLFAAVRVVLVFALAPAIRRYSRQPHVTAGGPA